MSHTIAILGATGAVGRECIGCLRDLQIPYDELRLLASARSAGTEIDGMTVQEVTSESFQGVDYAIFAAGGDTSREWAPIANQAGCIVIDNSSAFRYDDNIPLVVPEINGEKALGAQLIANPNCTTAIAAMAVYPLYKAFGIRRMIVSTYQSTSGAGAAGMQELLDQTKRSLNDEAVEHDAFAHPIPFNIIPRIDEMQENGYSREEMKVTWETHKIFADDSFPVSCTAVRIPVLRAHCESIAIETAKPVTPEAAREVLKDAPGVEVRDDAEHDVYPMPLTASYKFDIEVGRIRQSIAFGGYGIEFFVAGDQLLRGAALNALRILEYLQQHSPVAA